MVLTLEVAGSEESASNQAKTTAPQAQAAIKTEAPAAAPVAVAPALRIGVMKVRVPDIGDFKDVAVIELLVKAGDTVKLEQSLFTVESDKASMEIPSPAAGAPGALRSRWAIPSILVIPSPDGSGCGRRTVALLRLPCRGAGFSTGASRCRTCGCAGRGDRFRACAPARHALG